jgi:hypothetical protein
MPARRKIAIILLIAVSVFAIKLNAFANDVTVQVAILQKSVLTFPDTIDFSNDDFFVDIKSNTHRSLIITKETAGKAENIVVEQIQKDKTLSLEELEFEPGRQYILTLI